jgi:hypothetical protein
VQFLIANLSSSAQKVIVYMRDVVMSSSLNYPLGTPNQSLFIQQPGSGWRAWTHVMPDQQSAEVTIPASDPSANIFSSVDIDMSIYCSWGSSPSCQRASSPGVCVPLAVTSPGPSGATFQGKFTASLKVLEDRGVINGSVRVIAGICNGNTAQTETQNVPINGGRPF